MTNWVLDASAVIAAIRNEPGGEAVKAIYSSAILSSVNASEVVNKLIVQGMAPRAASMSVRNLACEIVDVDVELGLRAGELWVLTRKKGLSLGDRICLALAERENAPAVTSDRAWAELGLDIKVELIR